MSATPLDLQVNMQALSGPQAKTQAMQNSFGATEAFKAGQTTKKEAAEKQSKVDDAGQASDPNSVKDDNPDYVLDVENFSEERGQGRKRQQPEQQPLQILIADELLIALHRFRSE